jgi:hypothetical protein
LSAGLDEQSRDYEERQDAGESLNS